MVSDLYITGYRICTLTFDLDDRKPQVRYDFSGEKSGRISEDLDDDSD